MWIKNRIDAEYRKHKKLDWSKLAEAKILSQLKELIDERIDHYEPYRPITDSKEAKEVRKVLQELKQKIEGKKNV